LPPPPDFFLAGAVVCVGAEFVVCVCVWVCVDWLCVVAACVELDVDVDVDGFFAFFFFGSLLSAGSASGALAPAVTAAVATPTDFGEASFADEVGVFAGSLPEALLTPNATTNAARAAAAAMAI
jgi:hypothetical protein